MPLVVDTTEDADAPPPDPFSDHVVTFWRSKQEKRAKALLLYRPTEAEFTWRSSEQHTVKRTGFALTHANYLTSTASQGQTIRVGLTLDCERLAQVGRQGVSDDQWWLHLYVMFSRATTLEHLLILRPPPRTLLEKGPPASVRQALARFQEKIGGNERAATAIAGALGFVAP